MDVDYEMIPLGPWAMEDENDQSDSDSEEGDIEYTSISDLQPNCLFNHWIKARVVSRTGVMNSSGTPTFHATLLDQTGDVKLKAFGYFAYKFARILKMNRVFQITRFYCRPTSTADLHFNFTSNCDFELIFENDVIIEECPSEQADVPQIDYTYHDIASIRIELDRRPLITSIGLCTFCGPLEERTIRHSGSTIRMRRITLVDQSDPDPLIVTLWGDQAESFEGIGRVIVLRGVKINDPRFSGISTTTATVIEVEPQHQLVKEIRSWWNTKNNQQAQGHPEQEQGEDQALQLLPPLHSTVGEITEALEEEGGRRHFITKVFIIDVLKQSWCINYCTVCSEKVEPRGDAFYCQKCRKTYADSYVKYQLRARIADRTGSRFVTLRDVVAKGIIGLTAQQLRNCEDYEEKLQGICARPYIMGIKASKVEGRQRLTGVSARSIAMMTFEEADKLRKEYNELKAKYLEEVWGPGQLA